MFSPDFSQIYRHPPEEQVTAFLEAAKADPLAWTIAAFDASFDGGDDPRLFKFLVLMSTSESPTVARAALAMIYRKANDVDALWRYVQLWSGGKAQGAHRYAGGRVNSYEEMLRGVSLITILGKLTSDPLPEDHPVLQELRTGWKLPSFSVGDYKIHFREMCAAVLQVKACGEEWEVRINTHKIRAATPLDGFLLACKHYQENALRLITTPTHRLSKEDIKEKGCVIGDLDMMESDIGLHFRTERWLVVTVSEDGTQATEIGSDPMTVPLPAGLEVPGAPGDLLFAKVPVDRSGWPNGPVLSLKQIANYTNTEDLLEDLRTVHSLRQE